MVEILWEGAGGVLQGNHVTLPEGSSMIETTGDGTGEQLDHENLCTLLRGAL
jgi:hypothetical protein